MDGRSDLLLTINLNWYFGPIEQKVVCSVLMRNKECALNGTRKKRWIYRNKIGNKKILKEKMRKTLNDRCGDKKMRERERERERER